MTTHRAPELVAHPTRSVERPLAVGLVLAVLAGLAWIAGMTCTVAEWPL
ncbi:morphogenic membrane protein MmpA [Streptomyces sp. NPDC058735]